MSDLAAALCTTLAANLPADGYDREDIERFAREIDPACKIGVAQSGRLFILFSDKSLFEGWGSKQGERATLEDLLQALDPLGLAFDGSNIVVKQ